MALLPRCMAPSLTLIPSRVKSSTSLQATPYTPSSCITPLTSTHINSCRWGLTLGQPNISQRMDCPTTLTMPSMSAIQVPLVTLCQCLATMTCLHLKAIHRSTNTKPITMATCRSLRLKRQPGDSHGSSTPTPATKPGLLSEMIITHL